MQTAHIAVHHKLHRKGSTIARLKDHRTDGRGRRSATLQDFNIRSLYQPQGLVAGVLEHE